MDSLLLLGFFIGMRHAVEADHVAAVASLVNGNQSLKQIIQQGSVWGIGHTMTLFLFGSIVISMDTIIPESFAMGLEMAVGVMLIILGTDVLYRIKKNKIHFHSHQHDNGNVHFHVHSHKGESQPRHELSAHKHQHPQIFPLRALMIGMMHGMAGSAAVILLALGTVTTPQQGMLYILIFGLGSIAGMALLSMIICIPIRFSSRQPIFSYQLFQTVLGVLTIGLGVFVINENSAVLLI